MDLSLLKKNPTLIAPPSSPKHTNTAQLQPITIAHQITVSLDNVIECESPRENDIGNEYFIGYENMTDSNEILNIISSAK
tara:strand:+ start:200 stop:439 length:240 start_codon:yes stop_codon:yes gene_type:complete